MVVAVQDEVTNGANKAAHPLEVNQSDYDPLLAQIGAARFCLLGEATHGTHEFYRDRAEITKRLIKEKGLYGGRSRGRLA